MGIFSGNMIQKSVYKFRALRCTLLKRRAEHLIQLLPDDVKEVIESSKSTGVSIYDYYLLTKFLQKTKPKNVMEFGSGVTTAVIANSLIKWGGHLHTLEDKTEYAENIKKLFPERLKSSVTFHSPEKIFTSWGGRAGVAYAHLPPGKFDLLFIDGPTEKTEDGQLGLNLDLFRYLEREKNEPVDLFFDDKIWTFVLLEGLLRSRCLGYKAKFDYTFRIGKVRNIRGSDIIK